jgi:electron transport complex protein RnfE
MSKLQNFTKGFIKENPIFVFLLGMCPALAVTAAFETALGMGLLVIFVLTMSNIVISSLRNFIPHEVRTPAYIVIIATFVTIVRMLSAAYAYELYLSLGVFIPLIVVNCLILGRAEAFASKNNVLDSAIDGIGMGLGFTFALVVIAIFREFLATGGIAFGVYLPFLFQNEFSLSLNIILNLFNESINIEDYALNVFAVAPGAFIALGMILAFMQGRKVKREEIMAAEQKRLLMEKKKQAAMKKAENLTMKEAN